MTRQKLAFHFATVAAVLAVTFFFLSFTAHDEGGNGQDSSVGTEAGTRHGRPAIVRKDFAVEKKKGNAPPKFDPADYTTAPKAHTMEGKLAQVFTDRQLPDAEKVERLLIMVSQLPAPGKSVALDYATQLIKDDDYLRQRPRLLRLADTDELREVIMLDMLTRDDRIKMHGLVELMNGPSETTRAEAREILVAFLEQDYGDDPRQWSAPVEQWLAENQDI